VKAKSRFPKVGKQMKKPGRGTLAPSCQVGALFHILLWLSCMIQHLIW